MRNHITIPREHKQESGPISKLTFNKKGVPSWRVYGEGNKSIRFELHKDAQWLQIRAEENYESDNGRLVSRSAYITLDREDAISLREWLDNRVKLGR